MKLPQCDREQEVVDALRSGRWTSAWGEELRQHAPICAVCAEVVFVTQEFQREEELIRAELQQAGASLPAGGLVWWKAQLAARRAAEQRAVEPIVWAERAAGALAVLAALALGIWQWPHIAGWFHHVQPPSPSPRLAVLPPYSPSGDWLHQLIQVWTTQTPFLLLAAGAIAFLSVMAVAVYEEWRED